MFSNYREASILSSRVILELWSYVKNIFKMPEPEKQRDIEVYSRQQLVLGSAGLHALLCSSVWIIGADGLGAELAKNILLAGVPKLLLCDDQNVTKLDISTNICLRSSVDQWKTPTNRAQACVPFLSGFNPYATISSSTFPPFAEFQQVAKEDKPNLVVICNQGWEKSLEFAQACRSLSIPCIAAITGGLYYLFAMDLLEHKFLNVTDDKQKDLLLTSVEVVEGAKEDIASSVQVGSEVIKDVPTTADIGSGIQEVSTNVAVLSEATDQQSEGLPNATLQKESTRKVGAHVPAGEFIPLEVDDKVEVFFGNKCIGTATVTLVDNEQQYLELLGNEEVIIQPGLFVRHVPTETKVEFVPLEQISGEGDTARLLEGIRALDKYKKQFPEIRPRSQPDFVNFLSLIGQEHLPQNEIFYQRFFNSSAASTFPIIAITAGLVSEEVVKVLGKVFAPAEPIIGLQVFDNFYVEDLRTEDCIPGDNHEGLYYGSNILNFGNLIHRELTKKSVLVVGAGALGSEYIKGAAMMGIATEGDCELIVVDNDLVMTSNVSRQLFFTEQDKHKPKATTLCDRVKATLNPDIKLAPTCFKLDHTTETEFGHSRLSKIDFFVTALDNVNGRNTVDRISLAYKKPMIDGGTEGFEGNQENFIPFVTREYYNPHATTAAVSCSAKIILTSPSDLIHNAKIIFEAILRRIITSAGTELPQNWAHAVFAEHFVAGINDILRMHPHDKIGEKGTKFWKDGKVPVPFIKQQHPDIYQRFIRESQQLCAVQQEEKVEFFEKDNELHVNLMVAVCDVLSTIYQIPTPTVLEIRKKAGSIIPNIISTTCIIAGWMLLNSTQIAIAAQQRKDLNFINAYYGQAMTWHSLPTRYDSKRRSTGEDPSYIFHLSEITVQTTFQEVFSKVISPAMEQITLYGNSTLEVPRRNYSNIKDSPFLQYVLKHIMLGDRKYLVAEVLFQQLSSERRLLKETKFLIITLPDKSILSFAAELGKFEVRNEARVDKLEAALAEAKEVIARQTTTILSLHQQQQDQAAKHATQHQIIMKQLLSTNARLQMYKLMLTVEVRQSDSGLGATVSPLSLPNQGNTCFLASATQMLYPPEFLFGGVNHL
jgi:molybdopterin/thiamine biosynthesis adenylyltransferase